MSKREQCVAKGWRLYRNKHGEEVKLRHVLEKISVWVKEIIKVIDVGVSMDQSGHAALPWTIVKYLTTVGKSVKPSKLADVQRTDWVRKRRFVRQCCRRR